MKTTLVLAIAFAASVTTAAAQNVTPAMKSSSDVAVVVNPRNPVSDLTIGDLDQIIRGDRRFWNGKSTITLYMRERGAREREVALSKAKLDDSQFKRLWGELVFRGMANAEPVTVPSNGLASQCVRDSNGALAFVVAHDLPSDVKVLKIDGKLPGEPGYPLR